MRASTIATAALAALALLGCGGPDEHLADARPVTLDAPAVDATVDAAPGVACAAGGVATVMVDLGGDAQPRPYVAAWFNHGHGTKACFAIDVVLSTQAFVEDSYLADPHLLELTFAAAPVLGANPIQLHLHQPDQFLSGTATLTTVSATEVAGTVTATAGALTITGGFTAPPCLAIFDPCI